MENFRKLGLGDELIRSLEEHNFRTPTEIQEKAIPQVLVGKDVIAGASTGSGKTLVFGSGIIQNLVGHCGVQALVLVPTRELAEQVAQSLEDFSKYKKLKILSIYGGTSLNPQFRDLPKADIVVGTPGRILDHIGRKTIDLSKVKILVLDEMDTMLDMGFIRDVEKIINRCPKYRQTLLFSATISQSVSQIAKRYMNHPIEIMAEDQVDPKKLTQVYYDVSDGMKFSLLYHLLQKEHEGLVMVFCNTQRNTDFVARNLQRLGINALPIHGGLSQKKRNDVMKLFHSKELAVLICTDVAARGLDIGGVSHVYNYELSNEVNNYIHRIGRTARAGSAGIAISLIGSRDYNQFNRVINILDMSVERKELPFFKKIEMINERGHSRPDKFSKFSRPDRSDSKRDEFFRPRQKSRSHRRLSQNRVHMSKRRWN